jgi:nicotinamidase/pyrazinamidase
VSELFVIVDMQNDFIRPTGKLYFPTGQSIINPLVRLKESVVGLGVPVLYVNDAHPENSEEFSAWPPHCLVGSWGASVVEELSPQPGDLVLHKDSLSFFSTPVAEQLLCGLRVTHLYLAGVATEYCVQACALDARARGYGVTVAQDAIARVDINECDGEKAIAGMLQAGVILSDCATVSRNLAVRIEEK